MLAKCASICLGSFILVVAGRAVWYLLRWSCWSVGKWDKEDLQYSKVCAEQVSRMAVCGEEGRTSPLKTTAVTGMPFFYSLYFPNTEWRRWATFMSQLPTRWESLTAPAWPKSNCVWRAKGFLTEMLCPSRTPASSSRCSLMGSGLR